VRRGRSGRTAEPDAPPLPPEQAEAVAAALAAAGGDATRLLVVLQDVQHRLGHVPPATVRPIAKALGLSRAEVHGVLSFYHDLRTEPGGRHTLRVCQAESCQAAGGAAVWQHLEAATGGAVGTTTDDGSLTTEVVYCLGLCAVSPAALFDERPVGRLTPASVDRLLATARSGADAGGAR
jgi:formate dehydrogenase subunit gamma